MLIRFLSSPAVDTYLPSFLVKAGHRVFWGTDPVSDLSEYDMVVSFGYRHLLRKPVLDTAKRAPINLHISYLPYNRGAHPLFWASYEGTPVGVTIHEIDEGVDTGPIIAQRLVPMGNDDTFASGYLKIMRAIQELFAANWTQIEDGTYTKTPQPVDGTKHRVRDLPEGFAWSEPIIPTIARLRSVNHPNDVPAAFS